MTDRQTAIAVLLEQTGQAHHRAFEEVDGHDPEWPLWYAEHMRDRLSALLGTRLTISELVYLLVAADRTHQASGDGLPWPSFYAAYFVENTEPASR